MSYSYKTYRFFVFSCDLLLTKFLLVLWLLGQLDLDLRSIKKLGRISNMFLITGIYLYCSKKTAFLIRERGTFCLCCSSAERFRSSTAIFSPLLNTSVVCEYNITVFLFASPVKPGTVPVHCMVASWHLASSK